MIDVTLSNCCLLLELRPNWSDQTVDAAAAAGDVDRLGDVVRSPWMRFFELGPTASVTRAAALLAEERAAA